MIAYLWFVRKLILYVIFLSLLAASCGITKRHYRPGFYFRSHSSILQDVKEENEPIYVKDAQPVLNADANQIEAPLETHVDEPIAECLPRQIKQPEIPGPVFIYAKIKQRLTQKILNNETEMGDEPVVDNNTELARWYADRAMRYAVIALCFGFFIWPLFVFGPLALNRAKRALFLNEEQDEQIKLKAERAAKIVSFCFSLASIALLIGIMVLILSF